MRQWAARTCRFHFADYWAQRLQLPRPSAPWPPSRAAFPEQRWHSWHAPFPQHSPPDFVSSRGAWRAFCAGAILPSGIGFYLTAAHFYGIVSLEQLPLIFEAARDAMVNAELRSLVALYWTTMLIMGLMAAAFHWLFAAREEE